MDKKNSVAKVIKLLGHYTLLALITFAATLGAIEPLLKAGLTHNQVGLPYLCLMCSVYMSLLLISSVHKSDRSVGAGILCAIGWLFVGPWQWMLIPAALAHLIVSELIEKNSTIIHQSRRFILVMGILYFGYNSLPLSLVTYPKAYTVYFSFWILAVLCDILQEQTKTDSKNTGKDKVDIKTAVIKSEQQQTKIVDKPVNDYEYAVQELRLFLKDKQLLAEDLHQPISKIIGHTDNILHCMATDPLDVEPGEKFLRRYLPAVLKLIHNHIKFSKKRHLGPKFESILQQNIDALNKLEQAFLHQHQCLLQNDVDDAISELNIIDKLLKIEGHHK